MLVPLDSQQTSNCWYTYSQTALNSLISGNISAHRIDVISRRYDTRVNTTDAPMGSGQTVHNDLYLLMKHPHNSPPPPISTIYPAVLGTGSRTGLRWFPPRPVKGGTLCGLAWHACKPRARPILCHLPKGRTGDLGWQDMIVLMLSGEALSSEGLDLFAILKLEKTKQKTKTQSSHSFSERPCLIRTNGGRAQRHRALLWTWNALSCYSPSQPICPEHSHADRAHGRTEAQWRRAERCELKQMRLWSPLKTKQVVWTSGLWTNLKETLIFSDRWALLRAGEHINQTFRCQTLTAGVLNCNTVYYNNHHSYCNNVFACPAAIHQGVNQLLSCL